ncbi:hypothetical protein [Caballeronia insecticola]|uniref:Lipoprotein n=1 Tax=Caballeronia insecticola TaxID=758793 RepID=A0A060PRX9_9BURK|nr:hypothetical protein [Caballeronia insecticola]BAO94195.1 hypothetical protein BRPE64_ECDS03130 [Caballeronia insecticola]
MKNAFLIRKLVIVAAGAVAALVISAHSAHADTHGATSANVAQRISSQEESPFDRSAKSVQSGGDVGGIGETNWASGSRSNQARSPREVVVSSYSVPMYKARQ